MTTIVEISSPKVNHEDLEILTQNYSKDLKKWLTIERRCITNGESVMPVVFGAGTKKGGQRIVIRELPKAKK
jgi:hypothetical protein